MFHVFKYAIANVDSSEKTSSWCRVRSVLKITTKQEDCVIIKYNKRFVSYNIFQNKLKTRGFYIGDTLRRRLYEAGIKDRKLAKKCLI